jgi:hypothetical protein
LWGSLPDGVLVEPCRLSHPRGERRTQLQACGAGAARAGPIARPFNQRDPEVVCWPSVLFWGLGHRGQKTTLAHEKHGCLALPPSAARPNNNSVSDDLWFWGLGAPGLQKNTWPQNRFGIPLTLRKGQRNGLIIGLRVNFICALHHFLEPDPLDRVPGPSLAGKWPKTAET